MTENTEFAEWVAALPEQWHTALVADNVSTAFYLARRSGWSVEQLVGDATMTLARGGVGLVVTRLKSLADNPAVKPRPMPKVKGQQRTTLPECGACGIPYRRGTHPAAGATCRACGEPLHLIHHAVPA